VQGAPADTTSIGFKPEYIIGIATQSIALNGFGYVTVFGQVHGLNTLAFAVGDILWVDNATPGGLTNVQPSDPNFQIQMAAVTKRAGGDGHIQVRPTPFYDINRITNVNTNGSVNGQVLTFNSANSVWINANAYGNTNVVTLLSSFDGHPISTTGNVSAGYFIGNGSQLTGIVSSYGNSNVATLLAGFGSNTISTTGNINAGHFIGNGAHLTSITAANISGNVANATYATTAGSTTQLVNGSSTVALYSDGTMSFPSGLINTGSNTMGLWSTSTTSLTWRTPTATTAGQPFQNIVSLSSSGISITALSGNVSNLTTKSWSFGSTGNLLFPDFTIQSTAFTGIAATVTTNAQPNITSVGTLTSVTSTGNVTGGNLVTSGLISATGNITSSANISGGNLVGTLVGNVNGTTATLSANVSGGNLLTSGLISAAGNVTGGNINTGAQVVATGNITGGNLISLGSFIAATLSTAGNVTGANINTAGVVSATGNVQAGNIRTVGQVSATGTITSNGSVNSTAFAVGPGAISNVALGMFPTVGTPGEYAIRDYSTVNCNFYIDAAIGGSGTPTFQFRGSNSFTTYATISSSGLNMQSLPIQGQTAYMAKTAYSAALDTTVTVDNLKYRISNQGGVFPQVQGATGNVDVCYSGIGYINGASNPAMAHNSGFILGTGASWLSLYSTHGMDDRGDYIAFHITDKSAGKIYRVTFMKNNTGSNVDCYDIIVERIM
jgi:hypothetical protein